MLVAGIALGAEQLTSDLDPVCGLPRLNLRQTAPDSLYELLAADDPTASTWERVLQVAPEGHDHSWHDPVARAQQLRFYRWNRVQPRPPLAPVDNFRLIDHAGVSHEVLRDADAAAIVLVFTDNVSLAETWAQLDPVRQAFADGSVRFWMINPKDARGDLAAAVQAAGVQIPVLHDAAQVVARAYHAERSGEVVVLSPGNMDELYRGAISDRCVVNGVEVRQDFLADALTLNQAGKPVKVTLTRALGAGLGLGAVAVPDYAHDVAPVLQQNCVKCHRPGDIGSFAMTNHAIIAAKALVMRANLLEGLMPPWHADAPVGTFSNDQSMAPADVAKLVAWVDAGSPKGTGGDPLAENVVPPAEDWPLGKPDAIVSIPRQTIPSWTHGRTIPYQYLVVGAPFTKDTWLRAAVVKPGNRKVVHHALLFTATSFLDVLQVQGGLGGFFAGYVPGVEPAIYPAGTGKLMKKGTFIVFQMHYTPVESEETDQTQVGLYVSSQVPDRELKTGSAYTTGFTIPPGVKESPTSAESVFAKPIILYEMSPHMHFRGKSMKFEAVLPDGSVETLLNVPKYDFAWQSMYRLAQPKSLPAGTTIRVSGAFDNSQWNPFNPDPTASVTFGEQTSDEMFIGYLNYAEVQ